MGCGTAERSQSFSIGNKGYLLGGSINNMNSAELWEYDPVTDAWTQKASYTPSTIVDGISFSIGNKGYVGLGDSFQKDFCEYDPAANTWTPKASYGGQGRIMATAFVINGKGYVGMGENNNYAYKFDWWEYDPTADTCTYIGNFPSSGTIAAVGFSTNGKGYMATSGSTGVAVWELNPAGYAWTQKTNYPGQPSMYGSVMVIGDSAYVALSVTAQDSFITMMCGGMHPSRIHGSRLPAFQPSARARHRLPDKPHGVCGYRICEQRS